MSYDFNTLFFEDYFGVRWAPSSELRTITWSTVDGTLNLAWPPASTIPATTSAADLAIFQQAFDIWDAALDRISFEYTTEGNNADVTIAVASTDNFGGTDGYWTGTWTGDLIFARTTIHIDPDTMTEGRGLSISLHEIGNILGLGDITPTAAMQSLQEDPQPEVFSETALWDDDVALIRNYYGEDSVRPGHVTDSTDNNIVLDASDSLLSGSGGHDTIIGRAGNDTLDGGSGDDSLSGGTGEDVMSGGTGEDTLAGGADADSLSGGAGNDQLRGQRSGDHLDGGDGEDNLKGGGGNDTLFGGAENDFLNGGTRADYIDGGDGDDKLIGRSFSDTLIGGAGNDRLNAGGEDDRLIGGTGDDFLKGGQGADVFVFDAGFDNDRIADFDPTLDRLEITTTLAQGFDGDQLAGFAEELGGVVVLNFGGGDVLTFQSLTDPDDLLGQIDIIADFV